MIKDKIKNNIEILKNFGIKYSIYDFLENFIFRKDSCFKHYIHKKKHDDVKKYLKNKYSDIIDSYKKININEIQYDNKIESNSPIFVFWWQGYENVPEIVETCINSIKTNAGSHQVIFITKENYFKYANIPDYIIKKLEQKKITLTYFSDILRVALLYENGGIWLDATIYLTQTISKDIENYSFYTLKHNLFNNWHVCRGLWSTNVLGACKNNVYMKFIRDMFFEYWKNENYSICYFLFDCIMMSGYENLNYVKSEVDLVPINNENTFELYKR